MMKKIVLVVTIVVVALVAQTMRQPSEYEVNRQLDLAAPIDKVFMLISDFNHWPKWSPWYADDPQMKIEISDNPAGIGAWMKWDSEKQGKGLQTITDIYPNQAIKYRLDFYAPIQGQGYSVIETSPGEDQKTRVVWIYKGENKGFMDKFFYWIFGVSEMVGDMYDQGLKNLETQANTL